MAAETDYITVGNFTYNVSYDEVGPKYASVTSYAGADQYNYPGTIHIDIPDYISYKGQNCPVTSIAKAAFRYQNALSIHIGKNIEWIDEDAFDGIRIDELVIPASVREIHPHSLPTCKKLIIEDGNKTISFLKTATSGNAYTWNLQDVTSLYMGKNINGFFQQGLFSNLKDLTIGANVTKLYDNLFTNAKELKLVVLPSGLEEIGEYTFMNTEFTTIEIPASVKSIGRYAFSNTKINFIRFDGTAESGSIYADYAAFYRTSFSDAVINRNVESGYYNEVGNVFTSSQASLQNVEIGNHVTKLGYRLFDGCSRISNITFGANVKSIESSCFSDCTGLRNIEFPENLETIGSYAFFGCSGLTRIEFPSTFHSFIGSDQFKGCSSIQEIICHGSTPATSLYSYSELPFDATIYQSATLEVPIGTTDAYKASEVWGPFFNIIEGITPINQAFNDIKLIGKHFVSTSNNDPNIKIYQTDGKLLYFGKVSVSPTLTTGTYIVQTGKTNTAKKYVIY